MSDKAQTGRRFADSYPSVFHFLETTIWPDVDSYNLLEMLHRVMRHWNHGYVRNLVAEFGRLAEDTSFADRELVELFNRDVPEHFRIMNGQNCRTLLSTLADYLRYLFDEEHVQGTHSSISTGASKKVAR